MEKENAHRSSLLVVKMKDEADFGKYTCLVRDRFQSTTHTIWIEKDTGNKKPNNFRKQKPNENRKYCGLKMIFL
jgi:hypothetical protein